MPDTIEIVEPREAWPAEFDAIAARLRQVFGPLALRIEHIGSTSVPGLAAKDVIDVQVSVASLELPGIGDKLRGAGFRPRDGLWGKDGYWHDHVPPGADPDPADWTKRYARGASGERRSHIHIRRAGAANERYARLFRDYLRASPAAAATYAEVKRELAARHADDVDAYYAVKDPVCDLGSSRRPSLGGRSPRAGIGARPSLGRGSGRKAACDRRHSAFDNGRGGSGCRRASTGRMGASGPTRSSPTASPATRPPRRPRISPARSPIRGSRCCGSTSPGWGRAKGRLARAAFPPTSTTWWRRRRR